MIMQPAQVTRLVAGEEVVIHPPGQSRPDVGTVGLVRLRELLPRLGEELRKARSVKEGPDHQNRNRSAKAPPNP